MKKIVLLFSLLIFSHNASAFLTTFNSIGINTPSVQEDISLLSVDIKLSQLGLNVSTNQLANLAFAEVFQMRNQLVNDLRAEAMAIDEVDRIIFAGIDILPLTVSLRQTNNSLILNIEGISGGVSGVLEDQGIFCQSPQFSVSIDNIDASLEFNIFTGALMVSDITFDLDTDFDCNGFFGFIANLLGADSIFADRIEGALEDGIMALNGIANMQDLFGVNDLLNLLSTTINSSGGLGIPNEAQVNLAINEILDFLSSVNINTNLEVGFMLSETHTVTGGEHGFFLTITDRNLTIFTNF